jgi:hypothetical protein
VLQAQPSAWFEIPAAQLDRACQFYGQVFDVSFKREPMGPLEFAMFPYDPAGAGGALVAGEGYRPTSDGAVVYLGLDDIRPALARVAANGGAVLMPLTELPRGMGVIAHVRDSEGNRVGLWSAK